MMEMELNRENYHSPKMNQKFMGVSQFKSFRDCEARQVAINNGEWEEPDNPAFLLGNYVHAWNEGRLQEFMAETPQLFKQNGGLYAKYSIGDDMINALKNDELAMQALDGEKEVIITDELFGIPWKIMIDSLNREKETFTDLKTTREINRTYWNSNYDGKENFIIHWGYDIGLAVYAEIERRNRGGAKHYMPHILAVSKEDPPDKELIKLPRDEILDILDEIEINIPRIHQVWKGEAEPERCGKCDYCRSTKKLEKAVYYMEIGL
jgi:hypothetical protein